MSEIESGRRCVSFDVLEKLCDALDADPGELLERENARARRQAMSDDEAVAVGRLVLDLQRAVLALQIEVRSFLVCWNCFLGLFSRSKRVDLLNRSAQGFFGNLQFVLACDITISLTRITG